MLRGHTSRALISCDYQLVMTLFPCLLRLAAHAAKPITERVTKRAAERVAERVVAEPVAEAPRHDPGLQHCYLQPPQSDVTPQ